MLSSVTGLAALDLYKGYILTTDVSEVAAAACLSQMVGETDAPIAFISRRLTSAQSKWAPIEWEAFAIVCALGRHSRWL